MHDDDTAVRAARANELYARKLKALLEPKHHGEFVAIEPESETFVLGRTLNEAIDAARAAHPDRISYVKRVGYRAAVEIGNSL